MIDLDDEEARIGVRDGRFVPNPGHDDHPSTETTWAGALRVLPVARCPPPTRSRVGGGWSAVFYRVGSFPWGDAMPTTGARYDWSPQRDHR